MNEEKQDPPFLKQLHEYRALLQELEQKAQEDYDKAILTLAGGALGISFVFCKDIVPIATATHTWLLCSAWILWTVALLASLASLFTSILALRAAIDQVDDRTIYLEHPGSFNDVLTFLLNLVSGVTFVFGVGALLSYVIINIKL